jgi:hypothetical protein
LEEDALKAPLKAILDTCRTGLVYKGTILNKRDQSTEAAYLNILKVENDGALVAARIDSDEHPNWRRSLRGTLIAGRYRAEGVPLRLRMDNRDRIESAPDNSAFGANNNRLLQLVSGDKEITGEDDSFKYTFTVLSPAELAQIQAIRKAHEQSVLAVVKPGATYYGTIRHDSFMSNARIRFTKANLETGELTLVIESRIQQGIFTEFKGAIDPAEGLISVESSAGRINKSGYLRVPFFTYDNNYTLSLQLTEEAITGVITNDTSWKLNFLVNKPFTSASSPDGKSDSSASATSYPTKVGAYILSSGKWDPLPTNKGQYKTAWASVFGDLLKVNGESATSKLADLIFSGSDETPTVDGAEVAILFVGTLEHPAQNLIAQYPQLADYPPMEVAATTTL